MIGVRPIRADDWALVRELRLRALADAPDAFAATLEQERALPDARWQERAASDVEARATAGWLATEDDGAACGLVVGVLRASEQAAVEVNALWVAPTSLAEQLRTSSPR